MVVFEIDIISSISKTKLFFFIDMFTIYILVYNICTEFLV